MFEVIIRSQQPLKSLNIQFQDDGNVASVYPINEVTKSNEVPEVVTKREYDPESIVEAQHAPPTVSSEEDNEIPVLELPDIENREINVAESFSSGEF